MRGLPPGEASQLSKHQSDMVLVLFCALQRAERNNREQYGTSRIMLEQTT